LKPNLHASGITVIAEAVALGLPVIAADTGGLRTYFAESEISYFKPYDSQAIRNKIEQLAANEELRFTRSVVAQKRILRDKLTSDTYAIRHREFSELLLWPGAEPTNEDSSHINRNCRAGYNS
jgi:glycosyltransferase involved in cell wall biosynthesis